jgi:hypothetical protein
LVAVNSDTVAGRTFAGPVRRTLDEFESDHDAFHAIDMLAYIENYYAPGEGYRSDAETEAALQSQRKRTMAAIIEALERFTGERYGDDIKRWEAWRQNCGAQSSGGQPQRGSPLSSSDRGTKRGHN